MFLFRGQNFASSRGALGAPLGIKIFKKFPSAILKQNSLALAYVFCLFVVVALFVCVFLLLGFK